jgi:membrane protease YdiL (CAAX protease family)
MVAKAVGNVFAVLLIVGAPVLSFTTARNPNIRLVPRHVLYLSAVISQWLLAAAYVVVVRLTSMDPVFFRAVPASAFIRWTLLVVSVSLGGLFILLLLERRGWWPPESDLVYLLLPSSRMEKLWAVLFLAPTAALCEEFLYRGYLMSQLSQWFHSVPWAWGVSSAAFGLAHTYQRINGILRAALLGALLAYPVVRLGSIYPSMAAHFLIDALALAWLGPRMLAQKGDESRFTKSE